MSGKGYRTFPTHVRNQILERDGNRCRVCGRKGPEHGGHVDLEAHHMQEDPEHVDRDHRDNGTTMCIACHHLVSNRTTADDLPFDIDSVAAELNLLYKDYEILAFLFEHGPATTSGICAETSGSARTSIIERLWTLMGADRHVESLNEPLIDKDVDTNEWGYPADIGQTVRGRVPATESELITSLRDELIRRLLVADIDRDLISEFFGCSTRATFYISKRAGALRVPFETDEHPAAPFEPETVENLTTGLTVALNSIGEAYDDR